ncbi:hypothetical protein M3180_06195 [Paenibacillus camelliae]|nr:hypothetical protein [Paenibacillus camelliae]
MLNKLFEALTGKRQRVITVIPATELTEIRELSKAQWLLELNTRSALAQSHFEYAQSISAERVSLENEKVIEESTQLFVKTERSQLLESEYERLKALEDELITKLLAAHGIEYTDDTYFDIASGEVSIEEDVPKD